MWKLSAHLKHRCIYTVEKKTCEGAVRLSESDFVKQTIRTVPKTTHYLALCTETCLAVRVWKSRGRGPHLNHRSGQVKPLAQPST